MKWWILEGDQIREAGATEWSIWLGKGGGGIAKSEFKGVVISTVFIGFGTELFETVVFRKAPDVEEYNTLYVRKCNTHEEALIQHKVVCQVYKDQ